MSETLTVNRNNIELPFADFRIIRGPNKDKTYPAPTVTGSNLTQFAEWLGFDNAANVLQTWVKKACQVVNQDALLDTGEWDKDKFIALIQDLTSRGLKMSELEEQRDELVEQQQNNIAKLASLEPGSADFTAILADIQAQKGRILSLKDMIDAKSRKKQDEPAEASVPA